MLRDAPSINSSYLRTASCSKKSMKAKVSINSDAPLQADSALEQDKLFRKGFAEIAVETLKSASKADGLVLSIEGEWGSGKTSTLAMIEELLKNETNPFLAVHFNPWLIGDKDALLRHFLSRVASSIKLNDHSKNAKKAAQEIKAYSNAFDLVKFIPGAEPWATIIKSVFDAVGKLSGSVSEYKTPDLETYKDNVKSALQKLNHPIVIFIDDIDRLFPPEVFEMVRIIKSVGNLPHIAHVIAWDSSYVSSSLEKLGVPYAHSYLDKIVQVRMPLPSLSLSARSRMMNDAFDKLDPEARHQRFPNQGERLRHLYNSGLRDLLELPRDITRVFNALQTLEPLLRDEVVLPDILGISALSVKAPAVFELIKKKPYLFVGKLADNYHINKSSEELIKSGAEERSVAYVASNRGNATQRLVHFLFNEVASLEEGFSLGKGTYAEGCICHPGRLAIALQLGMTDGDISIKLARQYLQTPSQRQEITSRLNPENYEDFLISLGDVCQTIKGEGIFDPQELCTSITRLVDRPPFIEKPSETANSFNHHIVDSALQTVGKIIRSTDKSRERSIIKKIALDSRSLSCAVEIIAQSYIDDYRVDYKNLLIPTQNKQRILSSLSSNLINSANQDTLLDTSTPGRILWISAQLIPSICPEIFQTLKENDPTLDKFALHYLGSSWDSSNGHAYSLPKNISLLEAYCSLKDFKAHASKRLADKSLTNPTLAAWRSVIEEKELYGIDGTEVSR